MKNRFRVYLLISICLLFIYIQKSSLPCAYADNQYDYTLYDSTKITKKPIFVGMDLCGTIINSKASDVRAINKTIAKFLGNGLGWGEVRKLKKPNLSMKQNFPNFFPDNPDEAYEFYLKSMFDEIKDVDVFPGAFKFLSYCRQNNIKTALITNRDMEYLKQFKEKNKNGKMLFSMFDAIITADEAGVTKPNPQILNFALNKTGINSTDYMDVFFIGDALADANLVRNKHINGNFILMANTTSDITQSFLKELNRDQHTFIFHNYSDILDAVEHLK